MNASDVRFPKLKKLINDGLQSRAIPILYFDTNIMIDIIDHRSQSSVELFNFLIKRKWALVTSVFAKVEVCETKQKDEFRRQKEKSDWTDEKIKKNIEKRDLTEEILKQLSDQIDVNIKKISSNFEPFTYLIDEGWSLAEKVKLSTNLTDKDSIHVAEAIAIGCDVFLTRDDFLIKSSRRYILALTPEELISVLNTELISKKQITYTKSRE